MLAVCQHFDQSIVHGDCRLFGAMYGIMSVQVVRSAWHIWSVVSMAGV